eukprot:scaffold62252_cov63-Phaeocystis_antarctica.AAC.1
MMFSSEVAMESRMMSQLIVLPINIIVLNSSYWMPSASTCSPRQSPPMRAIYMTCNMYVSSRNLRRRCLRAAGTASRARARSSLSRSREACVMTMSRASCAMLWRSVVVSCSTASSPGMSSTVCAFADAAEQSSKPPRPNGCGAGWLR